MVVYLSEARKAYLTDSGDVCWDKVTARWAELASVKVSLANKHFTADVKEKAKTLPQESQQRLLDIIMGGLVNGDSSVGVYATSPDDYDTFDFYLVPIIRDYHNITGDVKQAHDWNIPLETYDLRKINPSLGTVSMRARVARNVRGWNLPPLMSLDERVRFEKLMTGVFETFDVKGKYYSLTPDHPNQITNTVADEMRAAHWLFNDMTTDNHLTSSGVASDWPYGRGIWLSDDKTQMVWIGEEDHLRVIAIVHGSDLGAVDATLRNLLDRMEKSSIVFAQHPTYGIITTCPTNMGTGKRQSILGQFPNITNGGKDEASLKKIAKSLGLQARGVGGEHSAMDAKGTADISPSARFGVTEAVVTQRLYEGLINLYKVENESQTSCC